MAVFGQCLNLNLLSGVVYFGGAITSSTTEPICRTITQNGNVLSVLSVKPAAALPAGASVTIDVMLNGIATGCSVTINAATGTNLVTDYVHSAIPALLDGVSFRATPSGIIAGVISFAASCQGG